MSDPSLIPILIGVLLAVVIWLMVAIGRDPESARMRLTVLIWFGVAVAPFYDNPVLLGSSTIRDSLPTSGIASVALAALALVLMNIPGRKRLPARLRPLALASFGLWAAAMFANLGASAPIEPRFASGGIAILVLFACLDGSRWPLIGLRAGFIVLTVLALFEGFTNPSAWTEAVGRSPLSIPTPYPGRLIGIQSSPNHMSFIAALAIVTVLVGPKMRIPRWMPVSLCLLALIFGGSQSVLLGIALGGAAYFLVTERRNLAAILAGAIVLGFVGNLIASSSKLTSSLGTFNDRTQIWDAVLKSFPSRPIFGFGPGGWQDLVAINHLPAYAVEGHNQVIDTLGKAGLVGLTALIAWVIVLIALIVRDANRERRAVLAGLLGLLTGRSVFEAPLTVDDLGYSIASLAIVAAFAGWDWSASRVREPATSGQPASRRLYRPAVR